MASAVDDLGLPAADAFRVAERQLESLVRIRGVGGIERRNHGGLPAKPGSDQGPRSLASGMKDSLPAGLRTPLPREGASTRRSVRAPRFRRMALRIHVRT